MSQSNGRWITMYRRYPAVWYFLFFALGIYLGWRFLLYFRFPVVLAAVIVFFTLMLLAHFFFRKLFLFIALTSVVLLGLAHMYTALAFFPSNHIATFPLDSVKVCTGTIISAQYRENGKDRYLLELQSVRIGDRTRNAQGVIQLVRSRSGSRLHFGDWVEVMAKPEPFPLPANPGMFNYRQYMNLRGVFGTCYYSDQNLKVLDQNRGSFWQMRVVQPISRYMRSQIETYFTGETRAVLKALLLGQRYDLQKSVVEAFKRSGIVHVLAISGLHVGFLLLLFLMIFSLLRLPYPWQVGLALVCLFLFIAVVDFKPPVVRAFLMAVLLYLNKFSERNASGLNILAVAGLVILIFQPQQLLWPDFQFSFAAVAGILYGYLRLNAWIPFISGGRKIFRLFNKWVRDPFLVSAAAVMATIPFTWHYYGTLQIGALVINILVIPLMGLMVILGFLFILLAWTHLPFLGGMALAMDWYYGQILSLIQKFAALSWVQLSLPFPSWIQLLLLVLLLLSLLNMSSKKSIAITMVFLFAFILTFVARPQDGKMRIVFVNVGQGDAAMVRFPNGKVLVIDGGDLRPQMDAGERFVLPVLRYYGIDHINYLLGTHGHSDHIGGFLTLLRQMKVDTLLLSPYKMNTKLYAGLLELAAERGVPVRWLKRGAQIFIDPQTRVYVLHPFGKYVQTDDFHGAEVNNSSVVLKIVYGKCSFLFTGDLEKTAEPALETYGRFLKADVLKVGHHGSITSSSVSFLNWVRPSISVVSVGRKNRYFHPSKKTMRRLRRYRARPLRTDHFGAVVFECDGETLRFVNWRK